jgi:peptide chain release factor subunit 1
MARKPEIRRTTLTAEALARIATANTGGHAVLSLYLDLDPSRFSNLRDRHAELDSVLDEAERHALQKGTLSHTDQKTLRADLEEVRELVANREELAPQAARGLAIFRSSPVGIFELMRLPRPVRPLAVVDVTPFIEPLAGLAAPERWCVLLVSRRTSRLFCGTRERLEEIEDVRDDVHGRHRQGGWSQARYQRGIEREADDHFRATAEALFEHLQHSPFDRLLVGGPSEIHARVEDALRTDVRGRLAGHFEIDVERASADEVHQRALPLIEASERQHEREALARLREGMAPGGHAATGLGEVLELLSERRVQTLLVVDGFRTPGFACPSCGWLVSETDGGVCPADGTTLEQREDVVEGAIAAALAQDAEVLIVRHEREQLEALAPVAALVRY